ncbi:MULTISPECIES: hypothetical protein [Hydrocarboniphaga]|jgi:hypothetical protein|uniref:hypothetical protein n=1 Tax=Hydrocarboniphaga TaxID=243627 RepID=UPI002AB82A70|nr:hypothetical protein [Hydrocarboniphaga sp.]MDZ4078509.1 hypothetical protein [Hydrocarboniphaga sp.]
MTATASGKRNQLGGVVPEVAPAADNAGERKNNKIQISLMVSRDLLAKIDLKASKMGQTRAAVIGLAMYQFLGGD